MIDSNPHHFVRQCFEIYVAHEPSELRALEKTDHYKALQKKLIKYLEFCTHVQSFAYGSWAPDKDHPGYLRKMEAAFSVRAPYHIVPAFPDSIALNELYDLSTRIRTDGRSTLCLSGSMAIMKSAVSVSDIDFCEYVRPQKNGDWPNQILKEIDTENRKLLKFKLFTDKKWERPVSRGEVEPEISKIDPANLELSFGKVDYLADMENFRPCEATNLMIFCDENLQSASLFRSFPAQEVPMSALAWIPSTFADVYQMGRYYSFLACQGHAYLQGGNPIKSIKRFLSLSRFSFMHETSTEISKFINGSKEFAQREIEDIDEIMGQVKGIDFPESDTWIERLSREKSITQARYDQLSRNSNGTAKEFSETLAKKFSIDKSVCQEWLSND